MKIDIMPVWYFLIKYSRKSRLKILLSVLGLVVLGIVLGIILALCGVDLGAEIVIQCALLGIISIPFLLLALIPKQRVEKSGEMSAVNRIVSSVKEEYKKTQKNSRPATIKERYLLGGILLFVTLICFWMGSFAILGGIFFSIMSFCCFCSRIPVQIQSRKKGCSRTFKMEDDEGKKK